MKAAAAICMAIALMFQGATTIEQKFDTIKIGSRESINLSVSWFNEKKPETATGRLYVVKGSRDIYLVLNRARLKELHDTVGAMIEAIEGK